MDNWPFKPMGIGAILDRSFQFYRSNFLKLFIITSVFMGSLFLLMYLTGLSVEPMQRAQYLSGAAGRFAASFFLLFLLFLSMYPVYVASIVFLVKSVITEQSYSLGKTLKSSFKRFWPLLGNSLLFLLITIVVLIFLGLLGGAIFSGLTQAASMSGSKVLGFVITGVGVILLYLSMLFLLIRFFFYIPLVAEEGISSGLGKSLNLTEGNFWRLLALFFIVGVIVSIIQIVFQFVIMKFMNPVLGQLFSSFLYLLLTPITLLVYAFAYFDLKARKEGSDLQEMIEANLPQPEVEAGERLEIKAEG